MVSITLTLTLFLLLVHNNDVTEALFFYPPSKRVAYPELQLATADRLGVKYSGFAHDAGSAASLPGFALSLDADFGTKLDEATFKALKAAYCTWSETKSRVVYEPGRRYTLLDFLPPLLQAVSGCHFQSSRRKQDGLPSLVGKPDDRVQLYTKQEVLLTSNCWVRKNDRVTKLSLARVLVEESPSTSS